VQHQARFQLLKNVVVVRGGAVLRDDLLTRLPVFALYGLVGWLGHNLSFYPMLRLIQQGLVGSR